MSPRNFACRLGIIAPLVFVLFIAACKKDSTETPAYLTDTSKVAASGTSTLSVDAFKAKSLAINYTGFATSYTSASKVDLTGSHDITITGKAINGGSVPAITLHNCYNVHITKNKLGNSTNVGIYLVNCKNITIDYNCIYNASAGVYVENSTGGGIVINNNQFRNMQGPYPRGQFVQFNTVSGPNNVISNNAGENIAGQSNPQDAINLFMSNGTPASPIQVNGNWIRGGGPSTVGGGIMLGDNGGSYQLATNNVLVDPGQYGMAIAGGNHITITTNIIYARSQPFTNVGIYLWGQEGYSISNTTVSRNLVKFISAKEGENDSWIAPGTPAPAGWSTNTFGANLSSTILRTPITTF